MTMGSVCIEPHETNNIENCPLAASMRVDLLSVSNVSLLISKDAACLTGRVATWMSF